MAWTKTKKVTVILASLLVVGIVTFLIIRHVTAYKGPSHFPKSAWASAGFGDPVSALETGCWAASQGDGKTMLASITPELQVALKNAWEKKAKGEGVSLEDFFSTHAKDSVGMVAGFRVLGERITNDRQAFVHIYIQGWWHKATVIMKKVGNDWKIAGINWK